MPANSARLIAFQNILIGEKKQLHNISLEYTDMGYVRDSVLDAERILDKAIRELDSRIGERLRIER